MKKNSAVIGIIARSLVLAMAISIFYIFIMANLKPVEIANFKTIDMLSRLRAYVKPLPVSAKDIVFIPLDDESFNRTGLRWPWARGVIATIINNISAHHPKIICLDFMFYGKSNNKDDDLLLAKSMKDAGNVLIASYFENNWDYVIPENVIAYYAKSYGFINKPRDIDNTARRMRPFIKSINGSVIDYSFPLKSAALFSNKEPQELIRAMPLLKNNTGYIPYSLRESAMTTIPVWQVLENKGNLDILKDKLVYLGITGESFHDIYPTPLGLMSGLCINVNEAIAYLDGIFFSYTPRGLDASILLLLLFTVILITLKHGPGCGIGATLAVIAGFIVLSAYLFIHNIMVRDVAGITGAILLVSISIHGTRYVNSYLENARLKIEAVTDGLTGLYVYRYFELKLKIEFSSAEKMHNDLGLIIYDIDHFKKINDEYGHEFGNKVLKKFAQILKENSKKSDTTARYGGEEFCVIAPDTNVGQALMYSERIRTILKHNDFETDDGRTVNITVSAGISGTENNTFTNYAEMIKAADAALYQSKNTGRNRVTIYNKEMASPPKMLR